MYWKWCHIIVRIEFGVSGRPEGLLDKYTWALRHLTEVALFRTTLLLIVLVGYVTIIAPLSSVYASSLFKNSFHDH